MIRLFLALEVPDHIKDHLINVRKSVFKNEDNYRWEPKERIHLTLKFIGDFENSLVAELASGLLFLESFDKIKCEIKRFEFLFRDGKPRILWTSLNIDPRIENILRTLDDELIKYGIEREKRRFKPHLTILRLKNNPDPEFINAFSKFELDPVSFYADKLVLYESRLFHDGPKYSEIKSYNLN